MNEQFRRFLVVTGKVAELHFPVYMKLRRPRLHADMRLLQRMERCSGTEMLRLPYIEHARAANHPYILYLLANHPVKFNRRKGDRALALFVQVEVEQNVRTSTPSYFFTFHFAPPDMMKGIRNANADVDCLYLIYGKYIRTQCALVGRNRVGRISALMYSGMVNRTIQNFDALAINDLRRDALAIAEAGYASIRTDAVIQSKVQVSGDGLSIDGKTYSLAGRNVYFVGVGKCAVAAAREIEELLGGTLKGGIALDVSTGKETGLIRTTIETHIGTHPLPSEANERAARRIIEFLSDRTENDLVLMLISGGGSALLSFHDAPMTYADESELFKELTSRGAPIQDINIVRKHMSRARGGALAVAAYPAEVISLIASDVPDDDIGLVASGPTVLDSSTIDDANVILAKYDIAVPTHIAFIETQKDEKYFKRVTNILFLSNQDALSAMNDEAVRLGYAATVANNHFTGEARDVGRAIAEKLHASTAKTALLYAGESIVTLDANAGKGGRNQEMALSVLDDIRDDELMLPFASDGRDNTDHAGAIADGATRARAREKNLSAEEHLRAHRSYDFFQSSGDALLTGYTGSNVSDLIVALKK